MRSTLTIASECRGYRLPSGVMHLPHLPHPWRRLTHLPHITLRWHQRGPMGWCRHSTQEVSLRVDLTQAERRSVLAHELEHLFRGPTTRDLIQQDERQTSIAAARWLLPFDLLAGAMVWANDEHELADELWCDVATVRARLDGLTPAEVAGLERRVRAAERSFSPRSAAT